MAVMQVVMKMSEKAALGIATGTMVRHGGVVYHKKGGIVEHLTDATVSTVANESVISTVAKLLKSSKILIAIGLGAVLVGGMVYFVKDKKNKKNEQQTMPKMSKCIANYNDSVVAYLDAINRGNVNLDKINCVLTNITLLRESSEITIDFAQEKSEILVNHVYEYTKKLANANSVEHMKFEKPTSFSTDNTLLYLSHYLDIQKKIFEDAA